MFNQKSIARVVKSTGICKYIPGLPFCKGETTEDNNVNFTEEPTPEPETPDQPTTEDVVVEINNTPENEVEEPETIQKPEKPAQEEPQPEVIKKKMRKSNLYFVRVSNDDSIKLEQVPRPVYYVDAPLTETLHALLSGLSTNEINNGLLSMIPDGTQLRSSPTIKNGIAYLNFNTAFTSTLIGKEASIFRLRQIIYTCTEFPTVNKVQFLINGKVQPYLSSDGIAIGEPLGRNDL
jgi:germination protein M